MATYEGSLTYCELIDRRRQYGYSIAIGNMVGVSTIPVGTSSSLGVMIGLYYEKFEDLLGWSAVGDLTGVSGVGGDINVSSAPAGTALTFSLATGLEQSFTAGFGLTLFAGEAPGPLFSGRLGILDQLADLVWGS